MCGIAGVVTKSPDEPSLRAMLDSIAHRGPDDEGAAWDTRSEWAVGLGCRRLAILDLSRAGHQPMVLDEDVLVFNGEIFNFIDLRRDLIASGYAFRSNTDTEVVLNLLHRDGIRALSKLNGMFALAYWNGEARELFIARDRFGIKPLYFHHDAGELSFASELKALLRGGLRPELDMERLATYLSFGFTPGDSSLLRGIERLPSGTVMRWKDGSLSSETFTQVRTGSVDASLTEADAAADLLEKLRDAVRRQLIADVPVGLLLSGGLDSTGILALTASETVGPIHTYTIGFRKEDAQLEQNPEDAAMARRVADHYGATLHEHVIGPDIVDLLPQVAWHLDEPLGDPAAILTLLLAQKARDQCSVLLSGQGADELFGGYRVHQFDGVSRILATIPRGLRHRLPRAARAGTRRLVSNGVSLAIERSLSMLTEHADLVPEERYVAFRSAYYFDDEARRSILGRDARDATPRNEPWAFHLGLFEDCTDASFFDRMLYVDMKTFLRDQNLLYSDKLSMAASIELRVPYLDDAVADLALRIPQRLKVRSLRGKHILRRALEGTVPPYVLARRKAGFGAPIRRWLQSELRSWSTELLADGALTDAGVISRRPVLDLIEGHAGGTVDHTYRLWALIGLELWWRNVNRPQDEPVSTHRIPR